MSLREEVERYLTATEPPKPYLSERFLTACQTYSERLLKTNASMNLTAITEEKEVAILHFVDSLQLYPYLMQDMEQKRGQGLYRWADVGTGAGFPGLPLALALREASPGPQELCLIDALQKRLRFLQSVVGELGLEDVTYLHARAEDAGRQKPHREKYDFVTARAVARLSVLSEYCLPLLKKGGLFLAMKGAQEEVEEARPALTQLGGQLEQVIAFDLPEGRGKRQLLLIRKEKPTPARYPRKAGEPSRHPL